MRAWTELCTGIWERYTCCGRGSGQIPVFAVDTRGDDDTHVVSWNYDTAESDVDQVTIPRTELKPSRGITAPQLELSEAYRVVLPPNGYNGVFLVNDQGVRVIRADDGLRSRPVVADGFATALSSDGNEFLCIDGSTITRYSIQEDALRQRYETSQGSVFRAHYGDGHRPFATCGYNNQIVLRDLDAKEDVVIADSLRHTLFRVVAAYATPQYAVVLFTRHEAWAYRNSLPTSRTLLRLSAGIGPGGFGAAGEPMLSYYTNSSRQQVRIVNLATGRVVREFSSTHPLEVRSAQIYGDLVAISEVISEGSVKVEVMHISSVSSGADVVSHRIAITPHEVSSIR